MTEAQSRRILALHCRLWHPRRSRNFTASHSSNRHHRPLLQRQTRLRHWYRQLCRILRRSTIPAHALNPLRVRRFRLGYQSTWPDLHIPLNHRKLLDSISTTNENNITHQHPSGPQDLQRQNISHHDYCTLFGGVGSLYRTGLPNIFRSGSRYTSYIGLSTSLHSQRRLFLRSMGARSISRQNWKVQHDDPDDNSMSHYRTSTMASSRPHNRL